jgi:maltooligosyltrehalose synthase
MLGMMEGWRDGRAKLALTATLLAHRREHAALFTEGSYEPLVATGTKTDQLCAFLRSHGDGRMLVVTSRFPARLEMDQGWADRAIPSPQVGGMAGWRDLLTGRRLEAGGALTAEEVLADLPVAVLVPDTEGRA